MLSGNTPSFCELTSHFWLRNFWSTQWLNSVCGLFQTHLPNSATISPRVYPWGSTKSLLLKFGIYPFSPPVWLHNLLIGLYQPLHTADCCIFPNSAAGKSNFWGEAPIFVGWNLNSFLILWILKYQIRNYVNWIGVRKLPTRLRRKFVTHRA